MVIGSVVTVARVGRTDFTTLRVRGERISGSADCVKSIGYGSYRSTGDAVSESADIRAARLPAAHGTTGRCLTA